MARLLDLSDEIILLIVGYLQATNQQIALRFYELADAHHCAVHPYYVDHYPPQGLKSLQSLLLASRRLNNVLTPIFYRDVFILPYHYNCKTAPLKLFKRSVQQNPSLSEYIISASFRDRRPRDGSIGDAIPFFWFDNIQTLTIHDFDEPEPLQFVNDSHIGTSPVKCLRLLECDAHKEALATVLSCPAALKILHYDPRPKDPDPGYWGDDSDEPSEEWPAAAFVHALQSQKTSLEELILTHPCGLDLGPPIDLSSFEVLKTLRIYQSFLAGWDVIYTVWQDLPQNLEVLEVFYDVDPFLSERDDEPYDNLLPDLIRHKRTHFPRLHSVTIYDGSGSDSSEHLPEPWPLPSSLASKAEAAGIKLIVWLGLRNEPNFEGIDVFELLKAS
jgi:hypothetical protein